jgi:hypothetical protein
MSKSRTLYLQHGLVKKIYVVIYFQRLKQKSKIFERGEVLGCVLRE